MNFEDIINKYDTSILKNLDSLNVKKIIKYLEKNNFDYIDELLNNYMDIFTFEYNDFVSKMEKLKKEYGNNINDKISEDMNILEKFYLD